MIQRITIHNWRPARDNDLISRHWRVRSKLKKADKDLVAAYAAHFYRATGKRRVSLEIVLTGRHRKADPYAYAKSLLDALVSCKMLVDDTAEYVEWVPPTYSRGEFPSTTIVLEDLP